MMQDEGSFEMHKHDRMSSVLAHAYEVLRTSPGACSTEQMKRFLRRTLAFVHHDEVREGLQIELASFIAEKVLFFVFVFPCDRSLPYDLDDRHHSRGSTY